jgi:Anti-sigma factor NepR
MHQNDEDAGDAKDGRETKIEDASAMPRHLGTKLRTMFATDAAEPASDRLRELLEALAAQDKKTQ